jgi:hypothetical protein
VDAEAFFGDIHVELPEEHPSTPFGPFEQFLHAFAEYPFADPPNPNGHCEAYAYQNSQFFPGAIAATGYTGGSWDGDFDGVYNAHSIALTRFQIGTCIEYTFDVTIDPGDSAAFCYVELRTHDPFTRIIRTEGGEHTFTGRLSPGTYTIDSISSMEDTPAYLKGATFAYLWTCSVCPSALIAQHPVDTAVLPGNSLTLSVVPTTPTGTLTYQWRRGLVPLANSAHVSGATTSTLSVFNPGVADTGAYDVVLTEGAIVEPSSLAHVTLGGITGVEPGPTAGLRDFRLEGAAPNPTASATSFRYDAARALALTGTIHDVSGRVVRAFEPRHVEGAGVLTWDGRDAAGELAAPGVYFLRVLADDETHVRRIVRLR